LRLVLASASPRRRDLLAQAGLVFTMVSPDVDESIRSGETPTDYVIRLAEEKARVVWEPGAVVIGADTVVVIDGEIIGKPADHRAARGMLGQLSGRRHLVHTGVAVIDAVGEVQVERETTLVTMAVLSENDIQRYVATGEPLDKAGAYALQGIGGLFIEGVEGSVSNVVGLPLTVAFRLLRKAGIDTWESGPQIG
jgi:septum formation protein